MICCSIVYQMILLSLNKCDRNRVKVVMFSSVSLLL